MLYLGIDFRIRRSTEYDLDAYFLGPSFPPLVADRYNLQCGGRGEGGREEGGGEGVGEGGAVGVR